MPKRTASAVWNGSLTEGNGTMRMGSGAYEGPYSFQSRFEEGDGTNPEELIAAAHAGCFSMALSAELGKAGHDRRQRGNRRNRPPRPGRRRLRDQAHRAANRAYRHRAWTKAPSKRQPKPPRRAARSHRRWRRSRTIDLDAQLA